MRIRSNVNLGALLEAQGGYHAAFDAAFSVRPPARTPRTVPFVCVGAAYSVRCTA